MQDQTPKELTERLALIESMIAEGRRTTRRWGWLFVFWGIAFYVAIAWSALRQNPWAWPVTMVAAAILTVVMHSNEPRRGVETTLGRAIGSVWMAAGVSMFLIFFPLGISGRLSDPRLFVATLSGMLGLTYAATGLIVRWKLQIGCAFVWWAATVAACFVTQNQAVILFAVAIFVCQIAFGIYGIVRESGARSQRGTVHA